MPVWFLADWQLFAHKGQAIVPCQLAVLLAGPAIVHERVMVVFDKIAWHFSVKRTLERQRLDPIPLEPRQRHRSRKRFGTVVIHNVAGMDEEVRVQLSHQVVG